MEFGCSLREVFLVEGVLLGDVSVKDISYTIRAVFLGGLLVDDLALGALVMF